MMSGRRLDDENHEKESGDVFIFCARCMSSPAFFFLFFSSCVVSHRAPSIEQRVD